MVDLLTGLIHERRLTLIATSKGIGTTAVATELAYAFATGGRVLGQKVQRRQVLYLTSDLDSSIVRSRLAVIEQVREGGIKVSPLRDQKASLTVYGIDAESPGDLPKNPAKRAFSEFEISRKTAEERHDMRHPLVVIDSLDCLFRDGSLVSYKETARLIKWLAATGLPIAAFINRTMAHDDWEAGHIANAATTTAILSHSSLMVNHSKVCDATFKAFFRMTPIAMNDEATTAPMIFYKGSDSPSDSKLGSPVGPGLASGFHEDPVRLAVARKEIGELIDAGVSPVSDVVSLVNQALSEPPGNEAEQKLAAIRAARKMH